jgi:magnesium-transporting ATPase (P-type)
VPIRERRWINLVTGGLPGLALSAEPGEQGIMQRPPRSSKESIFAPGMWRHVAIIGLRIGGISLLLPLVVLVTAEIRKALARRG